MPKIRSNLALSEHARAWAHGTRSASAYVESLLAEAQAAFIQAHMHVAERFTRPAILAVMDALSGHLFTPGMSPATEITMNLDDAPELRGKWAVSDEEWQRLLSMDDRAAEAFRAVAREFWAGRALP